MHHFAYRDGRLFAEEIPLEKIAQEVGTPFYCYSHATLERHFQAFEASLESVPHLVCFSVKSNSNLAVLSVFLNQGAGLDIVSGGELYRALKAGAVKTRSVPVMPFVDRYCPATTTSRVSDGSRLFNDQNLDGYQFALMNAGPASAVSVTGR